MIAVGIAVLVLVAGFATGAFGSISQLAQTAAGTEICDVKVRLNGYVTDNELIGDKKVSDHAAQISVSNCHPRGIAEFNAAVQDSQSDSQESNVITSSNPQLPQGAVIVAGRATIYETILDKNNRTEWGTHTFVVETPSFTPTKPFTEEHTFKKIPRGEYVLEVTDGWNSKVWTKSFKV